MRRASIHALMHSIYFSRRMKTICHCSKQSCKGKKSHIEFLRIRALELIMSFQRALGGITRPVDFYSYKHYRVIIFELIIIRFKNGSRNNEKLFRTSSFVIRHRNQNDMCPSRGINKQQRRGQQKKTWLNRVAYRVSRRSNFVKDSHATASRMKGTHTH